MRSFTRILALMVVALSPALAIVDDYSTGPGQGGADGLDDVWQTIYNGWGLLPGEDADADGCSNLIESLAGSDPRKAADCLTIGNTVLNGNTVVMRFPAKKGKLYQVWESGSPRGGPGDPGGAWTQVSGAEKEATADTEDFIVFTKPADSRKFYRLESKDIDLDGDGLSRWQEGKMGSSDTAGTSGTNASGGAANDYDTLRSLMSLQVVAGNPNAFEKEGTPATITVRRSIGTMPLSLRVSTDIGTVDHTKSNAAPTDYTITDTTDAPTAIVQLPANEGTATPYEVARVRPVEDTTLEVPEILEVSVTSAVGTLPGAAPSTMVKVADADPSVIANRTLYVAFLGREENVISTASGYATALVDGDNNRATISITFNNLSSDQNTAYIRVGEDLEVLPLPLGQVAGANWNIRAAQTEVTDQAMLNALKDGRLYVAISTANNPVKEIWGYFNKTTGSEVFDATRDDLLTPAYGSGTWPIPQGDALEREIWRFMSQATFGGTTEMYAEIRALCDAALAGGGSYLDGLSAWLDKQMDLAQTPTLSFRQLVMAADMEEFALRGNKPITYTSDPQLNGGSYGVTYTNGMPMGNTGTIDTNSPGNNYPGANGDDAFNRRREWWTMILQGRDQLRQRVTQALHEICVISERDPNTGNRAYGTANYWDMLATGAFGKYRTLLEQVTLNPMMGIYLTSMANRAAYDAGGGVMISPDENYAREIMQLFSIGLVLRHPDGSLQLNSEGLPISTYDNSDITELARVFTGFSHGARHGDTITQVLQQNGGIANTTQRTSSTVYLNGSGNHIWFGRQDGHLYWAAPWTTPMKVIGRISTTIYHDYNTYVDPMTALPVAGVSKRLLAGKHGQYQIPVWSPTGQSDAATHAQAALEVSQAHDCLAGVASDSVYGSGTQSSPGHTNTPINISRWLIQRLVTSNPSAGYIFRVQKAYRDSNGTLGAVVKAILLDHEARSLTLADQLISHGKVKEPLVHFASILRQFKAYSGAPVSALRDMNTAMSDRDAPMSGGYPSTEMAKFSDSNLSPASKPATWPDGPFRYRIDRIRSSLGQSPQDAPTVFNWFLPDYRPAGRFAAAGIFAPELMISNEANEVAKVNFLYGYTWMTLAGMSSTPGIGAANFVFRNGWATPAARISTNGGTSYLGNPATITLNETNWNTGITLTFAAINDQKIDWLAASTVRFGVTATAPGYSGVATPTVPLTFVENEKRNEQLIVTQTGGNTWAAEGGMSDSLSISLSSPPAEGSSVEVTVAHQFSEVTATPSALSFDSSNWNVPQAITVSAIDDADLEDGGTNNDALAITVTGTSANYSGLSVPSVNVSLLDNDGGVGLLITQSAASTDVAETGNSTVSPLAAGLDSYTLQLTSAPVGSVVVTATGSGLQINSTPTSTTFGTTYTRTFTTANWNVPQTIVVRGNNDTTSEGPHTGTVTHTISTAAGSYATTLPVQQVVASIVDDDNTIIFAHTGTETRVMEGDFTDTVTVRLRTNPNAAVSVSLGGNRLQFTPSQLTFNPTGSSSNLWSTEQVVTVTALDDHIANGIGVMNMIAYSTSSGTNYNGTTAPTITASVLDNDDSRLIINQTGGTTLVHEDGTTDSYTLALGRKPDAGSVTTVSLVPATGVTVSPATLIFTDGNWNTPATVTVTATNDSTAEPRGTVNIVHNITSTDPTYDRSSTPYLIVTVEDNDPALTITQSSVFTQVREGGTTGSGGTPNVSDTFTVVLPRAPATGTTVTVSLMPSAQITVSPSTLTFTSSNSTTAQTVTVTAVDDAIPEDIVHQGLITMNVLSTDSYYNGAAAPPVLVQVSDNDSPGLVLVESGNTTTPTEGGTDTYTVSLSQAPASSVVIDVTTPDPSQLTLSPASLTFSTANWATPQTVTVTAVNDSLIEGRGVHSIQHTVRLASSDAAYAAVPPQSVTAITIDQLRANEGIVVTQTLAGTTTYVAEGGPTDTLHVWLQSPPVGPVNLTPATSTNVTFTPNTLTFDGSNWNIPQAVTVAAIDDATQEGNHTSTYTLTASAPLAPLWTGLTSNSITVNNVDNDRPGVVINHTGPDTQITEGGATDSYTIVLNAAPNGNVTVAASSSSTTSGVTLSPTSVVFNASNWNQPRSITVTAANDSTVEANHTATVSHSITTASTTDTSGYASLTGLHGLIVNVTDNDNRVIVTQTGTGTVIAENGSLSDSYDIVLRSAPSADVTLSISYPTGQGLAASASSLLFTPSDWSTPQTVTLTGVDNSVADRRHTVTLAHTSTSADAAYNAQTIVSITATVNAIDTPQIIQVESSGNTTLTETSTTDSYTLTLSQPPTADVVVTLTADAQVSATPSTLTFTPANWNTAQTVSVKAQDDYIVEPILHLGNITHSVTSTDPVFNAMQVGRIVTFITDNDAPRVIYTQTGGTTSVTELATGQASGILNTDNYTLALGSAPTADVLVSITPDAQVTTSTNSLTFTPANWNLPQTVTVTGVDDATVETLTHTGVITQSLTSADPMYHGISVANVIVSVQDNESAGLNVTHVGGTDTVITEGGANDALLVKLNTQPAAGTSVTLTIYPPMFYVPPPQIGKTSGYFTNDQGSSNERDNIVIDYTESIQHYRSTFYASLNTAYSGSIPANLATSTNPTDIINIQNAHWTATKFIIDKMDLWFSTGYMKAKWPILVEPNQPPPAPLPAFNPRQAIMDAIYRHSGGSGSPATARYTPEVPYNAKTPPTATFDTDIRDRVRWAGYLTTVGTNAFTLH